MPKDTLNSTQKPWFQKTRLEHQSISPKIFISHKEKNTDFAVEKSSIHHFKQVIKVNTTSNKTYRHHKPMVKTHHHFYSICTKKADHNLIMRNHQANPKWETFYKKTDQYSSEVPRSWKQRKKERCDEHWVLNATNESLKIISKLMMHYMLANWI